MATEGQTAGLPQLGHEGEPIGREQLYIGRGGGAPAGGGAGEGGGSTTGRVMGRAPEGTPADIDRAVAAARAAFEVWSQAPMVDRQEACRAIGAALAERGPEIGA